MNNNFENALAEGTILNERYLIHKPLGAGGFGITYIGHDVKLDMEVAIKEYYDSSVRARERQLREAQTMARFAGENHIVNVRDFFEENQKTYIVMEYLKGMTLKKYLEENGTLTLEKTLVLLNPIMEVLDKIHQSGALHRDISPDNIMILEKGQVKLLDFGAAGEYEQDVQKTMTVVLKPGYAPIEQYQGTKYQGPWTDVYALCGVIYKCITGITPDDSLKRTFFDELQMPSALGATITKYQENVLMQGLQLKYDLRITSVKELMSRLSTVSSPQRKNDAEQTHRNTVAEEYSKIEETVKEKDETKEITKTKENPGNIKKQNTRKQSIEKRRTLEKEKKAKKKNSKKRAARKMLCLVGILAVFSVAFLWFMDNPYQFEDSHISNITNKRVTRDDIRRVNNPKTTSVQFSRCEISDEIIKKLSTLKHVTDISITDCTGFASLTPLENMKNLETILYNNDSIDGAKMFDGDFSRIKGLTLTTDSLLSGVDFLNTFSGLEGLYFIGDPTGIEHLEFLKNMPELKSLFLTGEENIDLSGDKTEPIKYCTKLERLEANYTNLEDVSFASYTPELYMMDAAECNITDVSSMTSCEKMQYLDLSGNQISDISAFKNMVEMVDLNLNDNQVTDIRPLSNMTGLIGLQLANNQIHDISALKEMEILNTLNISNNHVADLMPIYNAKKMSYLNVENNQITNMDGCEQMIELNSLSAANNQICDISKLNCATVKNVDFENNQITDLSVFANRCGEMYLLNINNNQVSDLSPLAAAEKLAVLWANNNKLESLSGLENKTQLYGVSAYNNQITSLDGLSVSKLAYLDIGCNQVSDISVLSGLETEVIYLMLEKNQISDISCLPVNIRYSIFSLYENPISDFSIVAEFENINFIYDTFYFSHYEGMDYSPIGQAGYRNHSYAVNVPLEQQSQIKATMEEQKKTSFDAASTFITIEDADAKMKEMREDHNNILRQKS